MDYKKKYYKYKRKYLRLKNFVGGGRKGRSYASVVSNKSTGASKSYASVVSSVGASKSDEITLLNIKEFYSNIPDTNMYTNTYNFKLFEKYIKYIKRLYQYNEKFIIQKELCDLKKKEQKTYEDNQKIDELKEILAESGRELNTLGTSFEEQVEIKINEKFDDTYTKYFNYTLTKKKTRTNYEGEESISTIQLGEVDAIIVKENSIVAIIENKKSFDDIPDALFQIKRTFNYLKSHDSNIVLKKGEDEINITDFEIGENLLNLAYIYTSYDVNNIYTNLQSPLKHLLVYKLACWTFYKGTYKKLWDKLKKIQKKGRYSQGVIETINLFEEAGLSDRIILV